MATEDINAIPAAYATLTLWEAGEQADLVAGDIVAVAEVTGAISDSRIVFSGWNSDATRFAHIRNATGQKHNGTSRDVSGAGNQIAGTHADGLLLPVDLEFATWTGLNLKQSPGASQGTIFNFEIAFGTTTGTWTIDSCVLQNHQTSGGSVSDIVSSNTISNLGFLIKNNIGYSGGRGIDIRDGSGTKLVYFNTFYGKASGSHGLLATNNCTARNNFFGGYTTNDFFTGGASAPVGSYNASDDATADDGSYTNALINRTPSDEFTNVTAGSENFHLKVGNTLDGAGTTIAGITVDIDGSTRNASTPSIGADETVSAATAKWFLRAYSSTGGFQEMTGGFNA
jgi:hypothetical protein